MTEYLCKDGKKSRPFAYLETWGYPHAKVEPHKTKKKLHETNYEKRERGRLKKYEANLQEETEAGRIFSSAE